MINKTIKDIVAEGLVDIEEVQFWSFYDIKLCSSCGEEHAKERICFDDDAIVNRIDHEYECFEFVTTINSCSDCYKFPYPEHEGFYRFMCDVFDIGFIKATVADIYTKSLASYFPDSDVVSFSRSLATRSDRRIQEVIVHELRHAWQKHNNFEEDYHMDYMSRPSEVDAYSYHMNLTKSFVFLYEIGNVSLARKIIDTVGIGDIDFYNNLKAKDECFNAIELYTVSKKTYPAYEY